MDKPTVTQPDGELVAKRPTHRDGYWTYDDRAFERIGAHLYYFAPANRTAPPYTEQRHVAAIVDVASDGTLAGVELISSDMPPPPTNSAPDLAAEITRLRALCADAYACIDVLMAGVGKITTPDGFFMLLNETCIELVRARTTLTRAKEAGVLT